MVTAARFLRHALATPLAARRRFPEAVLTKIEAAIASAEIGHAGELRFVIESALPLAAVWHGQTARERAVEVFSLLRVWDTEANTGVLIYLLLAERNIEIVADRGIAACVTPGEWEAVAQAMEAAFRAGEFERGAVEGVRRVGRLLVRRLPARGANPDELSNRPTILK